MLKRFCVGAFALTCVFVFSLTCLAQANPWNGSWKAQPSTYKYTGPTFSVAADNDGFTTTRGGQASPKLVCDGKPHTSPDGSAVSCAKSGSGLVIEVSKDGKKTRKTTISVSADGKTRTSKSELYPSDGAPFTMTSIAERVSGGPGIVGEWKETKFSSSQDKGILSINVNGDSADFKETDTTKPITCKLDGTETKFGGGSMSLKLADPHTLKVTYKDNKGTVRRENTFELSQDGKTITETDVTPAPSPSTMSETFRKM